MSLIGLYLAIMANKILENKGLFEFYQKLMKISIAVLFVSTLVSHQQ